MTSTPHDKWSEGWAKLHAGNLSKRALEVEIEAWEGLPEERRWGRGKHLEILREELRGRPGDGE